MTLRINQAGCGVLSLPGTQHSPMKMQEGSEQKKMPLRGQTLKMRRLEEHISFRKCRSGAELEMHRHADALRQGGGGDINHEETSVQSAAGSPAAHHPPAPTSTRRSVPQTHTVSGKPPQSASI